MESLTIQKYVYCSYCHAKLMLKNNKEMPSYICPKCDAIFIANSFKEQIINKEKTSLFKKILNCLFKK